MLERVAVTVPLPCFGVDFEKTDPVCQKCPHQADCIVHLGKRAGRISLNKVHFNLVPKELASPQLLDPDSEDLQSVYEECHWAVFDRDPADRLDKWKHAHSFLTKLASGANCTLRVVITSVMMAHRETSSGRKFYSNMLLGPSAERRVEMFRQLCQEKFGFFDVKGIELTSKKDISALEERLLQSEIMFGTFIVGYKIKKSGKPFNDFYLQRELGLDPVWLAIEPTYEDILKEHVKDATGTREQRRHRFNVSQAVVKLKKRKNYSIHVFKTRERILPEAVRVVLERHGFLTTHLEVEESPITDVAQLWLRLGTAIQHSLVLRFIEGDATVSKFL